MRHLPPLVLVLAFTISGCDQLLPSRGPAAAPPPPSEPATPPAQPTRPRRSPQPRAAADPAKVSEAEALGQIRRALRRLVAAEQGFYAENGVYTEDMDRLGYRPDGRTTIRFIWMRRDSWAASGAHPALPGRDCVIYVGPPTTAAPATQKYGRFAKEGIPACDEGTPPRRTAGSGPPAPASPADTVSELDAVSPVVQMRVDLRNLVLSQNAYRATQGIFSRRVEPLALQYFWRPGVTIALLSADDRSWSAVAKHAAWPGKSCVIWYGPSPYRPTTEAQGKRGEESGVPVCDG